LRITRSATKTVAGMLVGIAIDRGLLPGVQARLLDYVTARPTMHLDPLSPRAASASPTRTQSRPAC